MEFKVGQWVRHRRGFEGEIGEISGRGIYIWHNDVRYNYSNGNIDPKSKGYKYSYCANFTCITVILRDVSDSKPITEGVCKMRKEIANVFEKTKDAMLVEKWMGSEILGTGFITELLLKTYKEVILKEVDQRVEESKKESK